MLDLTESHGSLAQQRQERLKAWDFQKTPVEYDGRRITLPNDPAEMDLRVAANHLIKLADEEDMEVQVSETIECFPYDGLIALTRAMAHLFGWATAQPTPTMFGPKPPQIMSIRTDVNEYQQVAVGDFSIPAIPDKYLIKIGAEFATTKPYVFVAAKIPRKYERIIRLIAKTSREFLVEQSIYKGKSIKLHTNGSSIDFSKQPDFFSTGTINEEDLHLNDDVMQAVETNILVPIQRKEACIAARVPIKRGVLLEGPYGTGKTLISTITSKVATAHGWTFILIEDVTALKGALDLAKRYQPAIVFAEDLDRAVTLDRDDTANDILNTIDGVLSKDSEVMVVFTTNHIENIAKAMLRPGRLDAVISIRAPNADTCGKLIRYYGRGMIGAQEDLTAVCAELSGQIPATIREVVERSKLHTIARMVGSEMPPIEARDLYNTALQMKAHLALLNEVADDETVAEKFVGHLKTIIVESLLESGNGTLDDLATSADVRDAADETQDTVIQHLTDKVKTIVEEGSLSFKDAKKASLEAIADTH